MGFTFEGAFYKARASLSQHSYPIHTMGFEGYVCYMRLEEAEALAQKYFNTAFLYIDYRTWGGLIKSMNTILFHKGSKTKDSIRSSNFPTYVIPKYLILKIKNFGFTEYGKPKENGLLSDSFEPFEREFRHLIENQ